jgi:hypothetical protein
MESTTYTTGEQLPASGINALRKDILLQAGELVTSTGSSNAYVLSVDSQIDAYVTGQKVRFQANHASTAAVTVNVNSLGAKAVKFADGTVVGAGHIVSGQMVELAYNGTDFILVGLGTDLVAHRFWGSPTYIMNAAYETADGLNLLINYQNSYAVKITRSTNTGIWPTHLTAGPTTLYAPILYSEGGTEYAMGVAGSPADIKRAALADFSTVSMSFSGEAPSSLYVPKAYCSTDGYIYMLNSTSGTTVKKYSVSGTTLTFVEDLTLSDAPVAAELMMISGDQLIIEDREATYDFYIKVYNLTTGVLESSQKLSYNYRGCVLIQNKDKSIARLPLLKQGQNPGDRAYHTMFPV